MSKQQNLYQHKFPIQYTIKHKNKPYTPYLIKYTDYPFFLPILNYKFTQLMCKHHKTKRFFYQLNFYFMNKITGLGKYLFAIPLAIFGIMHFMAAGDMAAMAPGGAPMVYFTGLCLLAASVSILIGKFDKLAAVLLALMMLLFGFIVHAPAMAENPAEMGNLMKNVALAGAALMYAHSMAKDPSVIG
jgi:putative oxidoreductase